MLKKTFALALFALFYGFTSPEVLAQETNTDVVYLMDGTAVKGKIVEYDVFKKLVIQTTDGKIVEYRIQEVDRVVKGDVSSTQPKKEKDENPQYTAPVDAENATPETYQEAPDQKKVGFNPAEMGKKNRFAFFISPGAMFDFNAPGGTGRGGGMILNPLDFGQNMTGIGSVSAGINIIPQYSVGLGLNVTGFDDRAYLGVFLDNRVTFLKRKVTPVFYAQGGYAFATNTTWEKAAVGGLFGEVGAGLKIHFNSTKALMITFGWYYHEYSYTYEAYQCDAFYTNCQLVDLTDKLIYRRFPLRVTFQF